MHRFLMDVRVGRVVDKFLSQQGFDVKSILDVNPSMPDEAIIELAIQESRILVTMDKDFGELVYRSKRIGVKGVLLLRLEDALAEDKKKIVEIILNEYSEEIGNSFMVYQNGKLRIRKLLQ